MERDLSNEFLEIIKEVVAPQFKILGFKKTNLTFKRSINSVVQLVRIQKSIWNYQGRIRFTMNYAFFNDIILQRFHRKTLRSKDVNENMGFVNGRTGHLIYDYDYWYELNKESESYMTQIQVKKDLEVVLIPFLIRHDSVESFLDLIRRPEIRPKGLIMNMDVGAIIELEFGDFDKGKNILKNSYAEAIIPKSVSSTTRHPDGREEIKWSKPSIRTFYVKELKRLASHYDIDLDD